MSAENLVVTEGKDTRFGMKVPIHCTDVKFDPYITCHARRLQLLKFYPLFRSSSNYTMFCWMIYWACFKINLFSVHFRAVSDLSSVFLSKKAFCVCVNAKNSVVIKARYTKFCMMVPVYHAHEHFKFYIRCHAQRLQKQKYILLVRY